MPATAYTTAVLTINAALKGYAPSNTVFTAEVQDAATMGTSAYANSMVSSSMSNADLSALVMTNMGLAPNADLQTALTQVFALNANARGQVILNLGALLSNIPNSTDPTLVATYGTAASNWNGGLAQAYAHSSVAANTVPTPFVFTPDLTGTYFTLTLASAAGADVMRLTGDQDVRIDFTDLLKQVRGLDLNGDGLIANDGSENNYPLGANSALTNHPTDNKFEIVDAYRRDAFNDSDRGSNFLGDIAFDGTGQNGDGVSTNGNIFLGGLGHDTAFGGNGNDFLAGGGIAQGHGGTDVMSGVRNADFFFAEFSGIDATDGGPTLRIDGGNTSDSNSAGTTQTAQDSDWLLFEASDDDEPVMIWLNNDNTTSTDNRDSVLARLPQNLGEGDGLVDGMGRVLSRSGESMLLDDVENVDASGNLYGFLKNLDVQLGGRGGDSRDPAFAAGSANNGQGSSAQLQISGSNVANKIIGGFDNDFIEGRDGNDLLMGGNLKSYLANGTTIAQQLINPNLLTIVNDGRDELIGGGGADNIVFEADAGIIEGGATIDIDDAATDTLWLTNMSLGTSTAAVMATDGILRFDLGVGKVGGVDNFSGYGGADAGGTATSYTADQTNYAGAGRVQVQDMENVIATGLGAVDFAAAGSNTPELVFDNQQNFQRFTTSLDLRGTDGVNILYASNGTDVLEGRAGGTLTTDETGAVTGDGRDKLSGGEGDDDFVFGTLDGITNIGDGVDVIHRQADVNGDNLWDGYNAVTGAGGTFVQDFGQVSTAITANSKLTLTLVDTAHPADLTGFPVNGVAFKLDGVSYTVALTAGVQGTYDQFVAGLNAALDANPALTALDAVLNADKTITITDPAGKTFVSVGYTWVGNVTPPAGTLTWNQAVGGPAVTQTQDRLIYRSYEDRADGELTDDNAVTGSAISLGTDAYAEDLVISFQADGTRLAEDQSYDVTYTNLTTQDIVTTTVNAVTYTLQVGVDLDGNSIAGEDSASGATQAAIQTAFLTRYAAFINSFMDNDSAAGQVGAAFAGSTITLTQVDYNGEDTVFMVTPTVTLQNLSGGEPASVEIVNMSQHEVHLLNYDARNLDGAGKNFDTNNVLFVGDTNVNQALLQTANNLTGGTVTGTIADLVDGGVNDLAGFAQNTAPNSPLMLVNFSAHGDDFLIGGAGADVINGLTGDDRVHGSRGVDTMDGGKNYYAVQVLGEAEARVLTWNVWEAANPASAQSLLADPTLAGKVISSITLIAQTESGTALASGLFDDTLQYNQGDFNTGATRFTVTLDNYTVSGGVVSLNNGGAGHVTVDLTGDGATADDSTSAFSNFENVRTVSGTGKAVAGVGGGQGNDTLNVAGLSTATGGIVYSLMNNGLTEGAVTITAGEVRYSANAHASLTRPTLADYESLVLKVDGVENVIAGLGDDLLVIDETEAAKDNSFSADLGDDRIEYRNIFDAVPATDKVAQPTVTIKVNTAADQDKVEMTSGRVGTVVATDTLNSVEFITLADGTATSARENDVLDVRAMTTGAVVSYVDGTVKDLAGVTQVTVENLYQVEKVMADGDDTVIVASSAIMNLNTRSDTGVDATPNKDLTFATFLDYDDLTAANARMAFTSLAGGLGGGNGFIEDWTNAGQFTFDMGTIGSDTVDYSKSVDAIAARVELDTAQANQYVLVDSSAGAFDATVAAGDRVDVLVSAEKIVASQAESVLDMTSSTKGLEIKFGAAAVQSAGDLAVDRNTFNVQISDLSSSVPLTRSFVEYRDANLNASTAIPVLATATWNRIEGSDNAEKVIMNSAHSMDTDAFNLRGGANEVKYNELTKSITLSLSVSDFVAATPLTTGKVTGLVTFQDGTGAGVTGPLIAGSGTHTITSYTANNGIAAGSLRVAASQDAEDNLALSGLDEKVFLVSEIGTIDNQITVKLGSGAAQNSVVLTGFELVSDAASNDVYDFGSLVNAAAGLNFIDSGVNDHDTVKVDNTAVGFDGTNALGGIDGNTATNDPVVAGATEISLGAIRDNGALAIAGFDFDVLDVSKVTDLTVTTVTGALAGSGGAETNTDEVVFGKINNVVSALGFEAVVLTEATIGENGTTYVLNATGDSLTAGAKSVTLTNGANTLSFGGTVLEQTGVTLRAATALNATSAVTVTTTDTGAEGVSITGGNGNDSLTGAAGADTLRGNSGDDTLNGNFVPEKVEVHTFTLSNTTGGADVDTMTIDGFVVAEGATVQGIIVANDDADAFGAAFVRQWGASASSFTNSASIQSVTYDALTNALTFTFTSAAGDVANALIAGAGSEAGTVGAETVTQAYAARAESLDTYVFETTAALNGVDTINNFNKTGAAATDDVLNVSAFLGGAIAGTVQAANMTVGLDLTGVANYGVVFNKASLAAADISLAVTAGKIAVEDNSKAVVLVTADTDGVADATINAYDVYFVQDTDTGTGQTYSVTKVATLNSTAAELSALAMDNTTAITGTAGADVLLGTAGADVITGLAGADTLTGGLGADSFVFATGASGITLATADTITDFVTTSDTVATSKAAADATEADGTALADFTAFVAAADAVLAAGVGVNDIYIAWNAAGSGNAWVVVDENDSGSVDAGDTLIVLTGINLAAEIAPADFT